MVYIIDIIFTKVPKTIFDNYSCEIIHRGYKIRRYELDFTFVELLEYMGFLYYHKANIVRLTQKNENNTTVIIDEFKDEY